MEESEMFNSVWNTFEDKCEELFVMGYALPQPLQVRALNSLDQKLFKWKLDVDSTDSMPDTTNSISGSALGSIDNTLSLDMEVCDSDFLDNLLEKVATGSKPQSPETEPIRTRAKRQATKKKLPDDFVSPFLSKKKLKRSIKTEPTDTHNKEDLIEDQNLDHVSPKNDVTHSSTTRTLRRKSVKTVKEEKVHEADASESDNIVTCSPKSEVVHSSSTRTLRRKSVKTVKDERLSEAHVSELDNTVSCSAKSETVKTKSDQSGEVESDNRMPQSVGQKYVKDVEKTCLADGQVSTQVFEPEQNISSSCELKKIKTESDVSGTTCIVQQKISKTVKSSKKARKTRGKKSSIIHKKTKVTDLVENKSEPHDGSKSLSDLADEKVKIDEDFDASSCKKETTDEPSIKKDTRFQEKTKTAIRTEKKFNCPHCKRKFREEYLLLAHKHLHDKAPITCPQCPKTFFSRGGFVAHVRMHMEHEIKRCPHCDYMSGSQAMVNAHVKQKHEKRLRYLCDICGKGFVTGDRVKRHRMAVHCSSDARGQFKCSECKFETHTKALLTMHYRNKHMERPGFVCTECGVVLKYKASLEEHHRRKHSKDSVLRPYKCDACPYKTATENELKKHVAHKHKTKDCKLEDDSVLAESHVDNEEVEGTDINASMYIVKTTEDVQEAEVANEGEMFKCCELLCDFQSPRDSEYRKHARLVHGIVNPYYSCNICGAKMKHKQTLADHVKRHFSTKNYQCSLCTFLGATIKDVRNHINRMHSNTEYRCSVCSKAFKQKGHLKRHMVIHTGQKNFACAYCSYRCNVQSNLAKHMALVHQKKERLRNTVEKIDTENLSVIQEPSTEIVYEIPVDISKQDIVETVASEVDIAASQIDETVVESDVGAEIFAGVTDVKYEIPGVEEELGENTYQQIVFIPAGTDLNQVGFVDEEGHQLYVI